MRDSLLIELLTEELPPNSLVALRDAFSGGIAQGLQQQGLLAAESTVRSFVTPRRLAVLVSDVLGTQPDRYMERKGPSLATGLDKDGKPTQALLGFAKSCGVSYETLEHTEGEKGSQFVYRFVEPGKALSDLLTPLVAETIKALPAPKLMRWGKGESQFVRPVHGLVMMYGSMIVAGEMMEVQSGNITSGHRLMSKGAIAIPSAGAYQAVLKKKGKVIASFEARKKKIVQLITKEEEKHQACIISPGEINSSPDRPDQKLRAHLEILKARNSLIDEVVALVEYPGVYVGRFDDALLQLPMECLTLSMRQHQKYFPLFSRQGVLLPKFLFVSNLDAKDPQAIIQGNEYVLRARLADAKFFFDHDRKTKLEARVVKLTDVVYHGKLGSQLQRVERIVKLAGMIAQKIGVDVALSEEAAYLCKADLLTDMVGEFPELQGTIGRYYALHDAKPEPVANAIEEHYLPRSTNDERLPSGVGAAVALADRLDVIVGMIGVGLGPTGDKDPFALRRHALAALRIIIDLELPLDLLELLQLAQAQFPREVISGSVVADVDRFVLDRLRYYLREKGYESNDIEAVVSQIGGQIAQVLPKLKAVQAFKKLPEAQVLAAANKRIINILVKQGGAERLAPPDPDLMSEGAEKALFKAMISLSPEIESCIKKQDYRSALYKLAALRTEVDRFFDDVMVMVDDPAVRRNREALLQQLATMMNQVADISKLAA